MKKVLLSILIALVLVTPILSNIIQPVVALTGGGHVTNTAPTVVSFTITNYPNQGTETNYHTTGGNPTNELNDDGDDYIIVNVTVYDANGEDDLKYINFSVDKIIADWEHNATTYFLNHTISSSDRSNSTEPTPVENEVHGWDNGTANNSYLTFNFKHTFDNGDDPANGAAASSVYTFTVTVKDASGSSSTDNKQVTVYNYADVVCVNSPYPYFAPDGNANTTDYYWGNWSASSGDTDVPSKNYLKATNDGTANAGVSISWSGANLVNGSNTIPLTNLEVFEGEAATPSAVGSWSSAGSGQNPSEMTVTHGETSQVISWVKHEIDIPAATPVGNYSQSFTWSVTSP